MRVLRNIILRVFLVSSITALPVREENTDDDDADDAELSQPLPVVYRRMENENGNGESTWPEAGPPRVGRSALVDPNHNLRWPRGVIPYRAVSGFNPKYKHMLDSAMTTIQYWTCLRYVPHTGQADFIDIYNVPYQGCGTNIGRQGGRQVVYLEAGECYDGMGVAIHELLHAAGLIHEHSRPDRDDYVNVYEDNMRPGANWSFYKFEEDRVKDFGVPYDYNSIMHYDKENGSKDGNKITMEPKTKQGKSSAVKMGHMSNLSVRDVILIRNLYNCYYGIDYRKHSSRVLPNVDVVTGSKRQLWNTFFGNVPYVAQNSSLRKQLIHDISNLPF